MLISFSVQNHLSFETKNTLSMVKSRERLLPTHVCKSNINGYKVLKGAMIYGANAGGKSNLIYSMQAARNCIVESVMVPQKRAFRLSNNSKKPIDFEFQFIIEDAAFSYEFSALHGLVLREKLSVIDQKKAPSLIYSRQVLESGSKVQLGAKLLKTLTDEQAKLLEALMATAPRDTLVLTDLANREAINVSKKASQFLRRPFEWFAFNLSITRVGEKPSPFELESMIEDDDTFRAEVQKVLKASDPSISRIALEKYEGDIKAVISDHALIDHLAKQTDDMKGLIQFERRRYVVTKHKGKIRLERIVILRKNARGEELRFELNEESEGIRRIIDLVPLFLQKRDNRVLVIDELDRSLHPEITRLFHDLHYDDSKDNQLILATHEHYMLSQSFYRRDEIWFVEKSRFGESTLFPLTAHTGIRFDKDIRKEYLRGTFGAVVNPTL